MTSITQHEHDGSLPINTISPAKAKSSPPQHGAEGTCTITQQRQEDKPDNLTGEQVSGPEAGSPEEQQIASLAIEMWLAEAPEEEHWWGLQDPTTWPKGYNS